MGWRSVIIQKHCKISAKLQMLVVQTDEDTISIPIVDISLLVISSSRSVITTYAVSELTKNDVAILYCNEKGIPISQNVPLENGNMSKDRIFRQFHWSQERKDELWKIIVKDKIQEQYRALQRCSAERSEDLLPLIEKIKVGDSGNEEATAARMYFPRMFSYEFIRSDESNEINALLNYGYAILLSEVCRNVAANGYLNQIGIHHDNDHNHFNLACDFMEPFRPFVDERVFHLGNVELTPAVKIKLVSLMQEDNATLGTTLSKAMASYIRCCFRFLNGEEIIPRLNHGNNTSDEELFI